MNSIVACSAVSRMMTLTNRSDIAPGMRVRVVRKEDQRSGALTEGVVRELLTKSPAPHGIEVRPEGGVVGRVKEILSALKKDCRAFADQLDRFLIRRVKEERF